jgi:hypothetical protein
MTAVSDLRHLAIEAATCLICADSSSCSNPDDCRADAGRYVDKANELLGRDGVEVEAIRTGRVTAFAVTDTGRIRVWLADGSTDVIDGIEVQW